ncbi:hypothetical protein GSN00_01740 [Cylindrospermopsis raciborskii CHAB3438]|nr:hypothetical protein [Cylindrospermopsis raciborskii CHAB3438]
MTVTQAMAGHGTLGDKELLVLDLSTDMPTIITTSQRIQYLEIAARPSMKRIL